MTDTMRGKTRQEADGIVKDAEEKMLDAESAVEDAEAELSRAESDCEDATKAYGRICNDRRKVFLGHTPDPPRCIEPFLGS